ncbi:hypothetical protein V1281_001762 [Nitrobacteraceae bacterium AZCC 2161]
MKPAETIDCHDCGNPVSFSAVSCPRCGSREPSGPYKKSAKEAQRHRIEDRNDRNLIVTAMTLGAVGASYGWLTSATMLGAIVPVIGYGVLGMLVGAPLGFAANMIRSSLFIWRRLRR